MYVSNNGVFSNNNILDESGSTLTYNEPISISEVLPPLGPSAGNFSVRVIGGPFLSNDSLRCRFGMHIVNGTYFSESEIRCIAPPNLPGAHVLEVTQNAQDYTDERFAFEYHKTIQISYIEPVAGPALAVGTQVVVYGKVFMNSSTTVCRFGVKCLFCF